MIVLKYQAHGVDGQGVNFSIARAIIRGKGFRSIRQAQASRPVGRFYSSIFINDMYARYRRNRDNNLRQDVETYLKRHLRFNGTFKRYKGYGYFPFIAHELCNEGGYLLYYIFWFVGGSRYVLRSIFLRCLG